MPKSHNAIEVDFKYVSVCVCKCKHQDLNPGSVRLDISNKTEDQSQKIKFLPVN